MNASVGVWLMILGAVILLGAPFVEMMLCAARDREIERRYRIRHSGRTRRRSWRRRTR